MNRDNSTEIRQQIITIASRFKMFECVECAQTVRKFLIQRKISGKQIKLYTGSTEGYYGNIYYDGIQAVPKELWLQNMYSPILDIGEEFQVTEIDF